MAQFKRWAIRVDMEVMTLTRYRAQIACLLAGIVLGVALASVVLSDERGSHGVASEGCVHITSSATVCGRDAKRICSRTSVKVATIEVEVGDDVTPTEALQAEECRKV